MRPSVLILLAALALPSALPAQSVAQDTVPPVPAEPPVPADGFEADDDRAAESAPDPVALDPNGFEVDPWERINRPIFRFNTAIDRVLLRPAAVVYSRAVPKVAQRGVSNFFGNLQQPITSLNLLLQGKPGRAAGSLGRFALNATLGLGGILDPATHAGIPAYDQDFGQTFHRWGWKRSRYIMLPLFGPATIRDGLGKGVNTRVSPISWLAEEEGAEYSVLYGLSARARGLSADAFLRGGDEYLLMRDAFLQYRRCQLIDCRDELPDYLLPDYEFEVPDVESIRLRR